MATKSKKPEKPEKNVIFEDEKSRLPQTDDFSESKPSAVENIISIVLGLAVVFVIGAMIVNVIRNRNAQPTPSSEEQQQAQAEATISARYTVQAGDTLWSIAEKFYNDGFKYPEIEKANNMNENSHLEKGMEIIIPKVEGTVAGATPSPVITGETTPTVVTATSQPTETKAPTNTVAPSAAPTPTTISQGPTGPTGVKEEGQTSSTSTDRQYTVVAGDNLWSICMKRYNNGYRWVEVAKMNSLKNPNIIHPGNVLLMP